MMYHTELKGRLKELSFEPDFDNSRNTDYERERGKAFQDLNHLFMHSATLYQTVTMYQMLFMVLRP